ncbi:MAG: hypothetical protein KDA44_22410 [Planctomycetales bacterium]|nr:hypothetical protein [Planctomycetales bacterium]
MTLANWQAVAELPGGDSPRDRRGGHPIAAGATRGAGGRRRQRAGLACSALIVAVGLAASLARGTQAAERQWLSGAGLRDKIDSVLHATRYERQMSLQQNAAWQIMHGVLAFGRDFEVLDGDKSVNVLDWVFAGRPMKGWTLTPTDVGLRAELEPGRNGQGHEDQWLAIISQCDVSPDQRVIVGSNEYKVYDIIKRSMYDCYDGKESSWTLIALSNYLSPPDQTWTARDGETWSLGRLAGMEAGSTYNENDWLPRIWDGACGGTHRLIGLTMALNRWQAAYPDRELTGDWKAAQDRVQWAVETAHSYQLPSGAFSIMFFQRPAGSRSIDEHLAATGHILEFLSLALSKQRLQEPWVEHAVEYLCDLLERTRELDLECGALYHAAHGLVLYRERVWGERGDW